MGNCRGNDSLYITVSWQSETAPDHLYCSNSTFLDSDDRDDARFSKRFKKQL